MADIRCPLCSKPNPDTLAECQHCGARLKPLGSIPTDSGNAIRPGEEPTKKSTAELEKALPDWLRNLRQGDEGGQAGSEPAEESFFPSTAAEERNDDFLARLSGAEAPQPARDVFTPSAGNTGDLLAGLAASQGDEEEIPDWLASIQGQVKAESSQGFQTPTQQSSSSGENDWLSQLEADEKPARPSGEPAAWSGFMNEPEPQTFFEPEEFKPAREGNDWFNAPAEEEKPFEPFAAGATSDTPDWLRDLEASQPSTPQPQATPPPAQGFVPSEDMPDWLRGLDSGISQGQPVEQPPAAGETFPSSGETPDWLSDLQSSQLTQAPASETPNWLNELQASQPAAPQSIEPDWLADLQSGQPSLSNADETPDWLGDFQSAQPSVEQAPASETPDWLSDLQSGAPVESQSFAETPDWLQDIAGTPSSQAQEQEFVPAKETPDWLGDLQTSTPAEQMPASEMPDWLADLQPGEPAQQVPSFDFEQPAATGFPAPGEPVPVSDEMPDWLGDLQAKAPFEETPITSQPPTAVPFAEESIPDWLEGAVAVGASLELQTSKQEEQKPVEPDLFADLGGETPDWLADMAKEQQGQPPAAPFAEQAFPQETGVESGEVLPWFGEENAPSEPVSDVTIPAFVGDQGSGGALLGLDVPDWLSNLESPEPAVAEQQLPSPQGVDESLMPSELPSWVQAMRPVESLISETEGAEEEQFVESQGPLAGMRNVLPVITGLIAVRKPAPYTSKLQVNDVQQSNAALLESMLTPKAESVKRGKHGMSMRFLRWMIALVLVVVVALPIFFESEGLTPTANLIAPEMAAAHAIVDALPENARILVVFDYEPSFSGEMATVATPLLDHLMLKKSRLVIVSSLPTGSAQAEQLLSTALSAHKYEMGTQYINLGYVPGGAAGINTFATDPTHTISVDVRNVQVWQDPNSFIAGMGVLSNFDAMVILTDNSDTGRIWIEQARDALGMSPLLFAISAQAEPMLRPYYDSGQAQGMVTGLAGGAAYENKSGRLGLGRAYWDAFSIAFLMAEVIVIVGGIWALIAAWRTRSSQKNEA